MPEALVDAILQPLGTKLANYMPVHRERAVMVAATYLRAERAAAPELAEALQTLRDYVSDASKGALTYEGSGDGFIAMAKEDLARIDAALAKAGL